MKCKKFGGLDKHGDQICINGELCYHCDPDGELCDEFCPEMEIEDKNTQKNELRSEMKENDKISENHE